MPEVTAGVQDERASEAKELKDGLAEEKVQLKNLIETFRPMFGEWQKGVFAWLRASHREGSS